MLLLLLLLLLLLSSLTFHRLSYDERCSKYCGLLWFMNVDVYLDPLDIFLKPFLHQFRGAITTGIVVAFILHIRSISISSSLYFSVALTKVFFQVGMDISMSTQLLSCLFLITMSCLLAFIPRSVCIGMSHKIVTLSFSVTV